VRIAIAVGFSGVLLASLFSGQFLAADPIKRRQVIPT
jgi:hypothetical protein